MYFCRSYHQLNPFFLLLHVYVRILRALENSLREFAASPSQHGSGVQPPDVLATMLAQLHPPLALGFGTQLLFLKQQHPSSADMALIT